MDVVTHRSINQSTVATYPIAAGSGSFGSTAAQQRSMSEMRPGVGEAPAEARVAITTSMNTCDDEMLTY